MDSEDVDTLVTLETSIGDAFVGRNHLVSIFFIWRRLMILPGDMVFYLIYTKRASVVVYQCLSAIFYLIVILKLVSGTYTLILTHGRQVSHRVVLFPSRYLVSRLIVLYLVHCLILNVPFM